MEALQRQIEEEIAARSGSLVNGTYKTLEAYREQVGYIGGLHRVVGMIQDAREPRKGTTSGKQPVVGNIQ